jgi:GTP-binding protein
VSVVYKDVKINIIDTPGHSDFGGQVERVLNLADGVLLLVDAAEGPMPQTRFVLHKALQLNLTPIVVMNKIDKSDARPDEVHDEILELFMDLDATDKQCDFPVIYASSKNGWADTELDGPRQNMLPLLDAVLEHIPSPKIVEGPLQMQVTSLDYSEYVGRIGIGRVYRGTLDINKPITVIKRCGTLHRAQLKKVMIFEGLEQKETEQVQCGDICAVVGITDIDISDTIADFEHPEQLPNISIDEPTISMNFMVNTSPLYGQEGTIISSRHMRERLLKETEKDVALRVEEVSGEAFKVSGRGVLHLSILMETMRREGFELTVSRPTVIMKEVEGLKHEPIEELTVDVPPESAGKVIELVGNRRGEMISMETRGERQVLTFHIPTRGIIGLRSKIMTATAGEAIVAHCFEKYEAYRGEVPHRKNGVLISMGQGDAIAFAIDGLQQRGIFFVGPNEMCYEGMIVGEHCKEGDLVVNLQKGKQLTNMRASGSDKAMKIAPPSKLSLEEALEYIDDDEYVELTPKSIRLRKKFLTELERKRNRNK